MCGGAHNPNSMSERGDVSNALEILIEACLEHTATVCWLGATRDIDRSVLGTDTVTL